MPKAAGKLDYRIHVVIDRELGGTLERLAREEGGTVSSIVRRFLKLAVRRQRMRAAA